MLRYLRYSLVHPPALLPLRGRFFLVCAFSLCVGLAMSGCGGGGGGGSAPATTIVFSSDRSVFLPHQGSTYQLSAAATGARISWQSSNPLAVSVSPAGLVTAVTGLGSATITASAPGASPAVASIIVAAPGPQTILLSSADVKSYDGAQASLTADATTNAIVVGDILVSGDVAGLLGKVQSVSKTGQMVQVQVTQSSLVQAFPDLSVDVLGAPVSMVVGSAAGRAVKNRAGGKSAATLRSPGFDCTDQGGVTFNAALSGPTITAPVQGQLEFKLDSHGFTVQDFSLEVKLSVPARIDSGSVTFTATGQTDFGCKLEAPEIPVPAVAIGPVVIAGTETVTLFVNVSANAQATLTLVGPSVKDTFTGDDGISWTSAGGWQSILNNSSTGPTVTPPGFKFTTQVQGTVVAGLRFDTGLAALVGDEKAVGFNFAFDEFGAGIGFDITSPLLYTSSGYTGPVWNSIVTINSGPELEFTGPVTNVFTEIGVPANLGQWSLLNKTIPISQSPAPQLSASSSSIDTNATDTLSVSQMPGYGGSQVQFYAYPQTGAAILLGSSTVDAGGNALLAWRPTANQKGAYQIAALLFGDDFGALGFPYASNAVAVQAGGGSVGVSVQ